MLRADPPLDGVVEILNILGQLVKQFAQVGELVPANQSLDQGPDNNGNPERNTICSRGNIPEETFRVVRVKNRNSLKARSGSKWPLT